MKREELLQSPEYWTTKAQLDLYFKVEEYLKNNNLNRTKLARELGVSKGYISQILNGDFDHRLSKLVELALHCGYKPIIMYEPLESNQTDIIESVTDFIERTKEASRNKGVAFMAIDKNCTSYDFKNTTQEVTQKSA